MEKNLIDPSDLFPYIALKDYGGWIVQTCVEAGKLKCELKKFEHRERRVMKTLCPKREKKETSVPRDEDDLR